MDMATMYSSKPSGASRTCQVQEPFKFEARSSIDTPSARMPIKAFVCCMLLYHAQPTSPSECRL